MKALYLAEAGGPEHAVVTDVPTPEPAPGEVRIALKAASLNHRELWIPLGQYPNMVLPATLGCDGAGVVDAVGAGVTDAKVGDEVVLYPGLGWGEDRRTPGRDFGLLGMPGPGTVAEYICVPAGNLVPKPEFLSWEEAAAFPLAGVTSWRALMVKGELKPGETLLISGIGGGVATFGLAFAVAMGARTFVTGETDEIIRTAISMGALGGLNYGEADWRKKVMGLTGGIDVVIDGAPAPSFANYVRSLNPGARAVIYGSTAGNQFQVTATDIFLKSASIVGSQVGDIHDFRAMMEFVGKHRIKPVIEKTFALAEAREALLFLKNDHAFGKVVISIR